MQWSGLSNHIEYIEEGDALLVRITSLRRWIGLWLPIASAIAVGVAAYCGAAWYFIALLAWFCIHALYKWMITSVAELRVTQTTLNTRVTTPFGTTDLHRYWRDIYGIEFSHGPNENDPTGLCTRESEWGGGTLLIEQVSREEAEAIVDRVYRQFYSVETRTGSSGSPLEALRSSITTLFGSEK